MLSSARVPGRSFWELRFLRAQPIHTNVTPDRMNVFHAAVARAGLPAPLPQAFQNVFHTQTHCSGCLFN